MTENNPAAGRVLGITVAIATVCVPMKLLDGPWWAVVGVGFVVWLIVSTQFWVRGSLDATNATFLALSRKADRQHEDLKRRIDKSGPDALGVREPR